MVRSTDTNVCTLIIGRRTFEWDEPKSEWTREKRGFDFEYAATVFLVLSVSKVPATNAVERFVITR